MKVGTKSLLFGYHQLLIHPLFVWAGWVNLYGWTWDPRIIASFFLHDVGYWGKPNMDGLEGTCHPFAGAKILHFLFDAEVKAPPLWMYPYTKEGGTTAYVAVDGCERLMDDVIKEYHTKYDSAKWYKFSLYHSRQMAKTYFAEPSMLCWADKKAFMMYPVWLLRSLYFLSGEDVEYRMNIYKDGERIPQPKPIPFKEWYKYAVDGNKIPDGVRRKK